MIPDGEVRDAAERFGVDEDQIRRDHVVSHVLLHLEDLDDVVFFGGTALCRTHLAGRRLSEDIDLLTDDNYGLADRLAGSLPRDVRTEFFGAEWEETRRNRRVLTANFVVPDVPGVKVELVRTEPHEKRGEYEVRDVELRYSDLPPSVPLKVPTLATFTAMKLYAWADRKTPRDLLDLAGLVDVGAVDLRAIKMHHRLFGSFPVVVEFEKLPPATADAWVPELAHQTAELPDAEGCLASVRTAVEAARSSA